MNLCHIEKGIKLCRDNNADFPNSISGAICFKSLYEQKMRYHDHHHHRRHNCYHHRQQHRHHRMYIIIITFYGELNRLEQDFRCVDGAQVSTRLRRHDVADQEVPILYERPDDAEALVVNHSFVVEG